MICKITKIDCEKNKNGWCMKYRKQFQDITQPEWDICFDEEIKRVNTSLTKKQEETNRPLQKFSSYELLYELLLRESEKGEAK